MDKLAVLLGLVQGVSSSHFKNATCRSYWLLWPWRYLILK